MHIVIHTSPRPLLTQILSTRHIITLTSQVCWIGLIRINIYPSSILWIRLEHSSSFLTESVGIQLPWVWLTTLPTSSYIYSFFRSTIRRTNWLEKEDENLRRAWVANSISRRLEIPSKFSNPRSLLHFSCPTTRRTYQLRKEYGICDSIPKKYFYMIESRLSRLENMRKNEETLSAQSLVIPDTSSLIDENQESWYLEDFD